MDSGKEGDICCTAFQSPVWRDGYCFYHSPMRSQYEYLYVRFSFCAFLWYILPPVAGDLQDVGWESKLV